jgi:hypothetical protein
MSTIAGASSMTIINSFGTFIFHPGVGWMHTAATDSPTMWQGIGTRHCRKRKSKIGVPNRAENIGVTFSGLVGIMWANLSTLGDVEGEASKRYFGFVRVPASVQFRTGSNYVSFWIRPCCAARVAPRVSGWAFAQIFPESV